MVPDLRLYAELAEPARLYEKISVFFAVRLERNFFVRVAADEPHGLARLREVFVIVDGRPLCLTVVGHFPVFVVLGAEICEIVGLVGGFHRPDGEVANGGVGVGDGDFIGVAVCPAQGVRAPAAHSLHVHLFVQIELFYDEIVKLVAQFHRLRACVIMGKFAENKVVARVEHRQVELGECLHKCGLPEPRLVRARLLRLDDYPVYSV